MNNSSEDLSRLLESHGAREYEVVALMMDEARGYAALEYALSKGADRPIAYALKMFDNPDWQPSGERKRMATNQSVEKKCSHCGGDRFVPVTADVTVLYGETYAPCKVCNAGANTKRWVQDERRETAPR